MITLVVRKLGWRAYCVRQNKQWGNGVFLWGLYTSVYPKKGDGHHQFWLLDERRFK